MNTNAFTAKIAKAAEKTLFALSVFFAVNPVLAQTAKSRATLYTDIDSLFATGTQITALQLRTGLKDIIASAANPTTDGTFVVTSGSYSDPAWIISLAYSKLSGAPALFSGAYADLTGKPTLFDGAYSSLTGKPTLALVATSGSYADLSGKPALFSGAYADLTGKPTLFDGAYASLTGKPTLGTAAALNVPATGNAATGEVVKGDDSRLSDSRTPTAHTQAASTISDSTATGRAVVTATDAAAARTAIGAGTSSFDGAYASLSGKPTLGTAAALDVPAAGDAAAGQVVKGSDTRLTNARTPTSHNHAASEVTSGTLTHEHGGLEADVSAYSGLVKISGGATSQASAGTDYYSPAASPHALTFVVTGGTAITTGTKYPQIKSPYGGTLTGWTMTVYPSGSVTCDILRSANGAGVPSASIVGGSGTKPAVSSGVENSSTNFAAWTSTTITALDNFAINVASTDATVTSLVLTLYFQ